jgi:hypothetical protein
VATYPSSSLYPSSSTYPSAATSLDLTASDGVAAFNGGTATYGQTGGVLVEWFMSRIREKPSLFESTEIITPSGKRYRWAVDEPRAENVPRDERWSDIMPGGFETLDQTLPRKPSIDYSDLERLSRVTRYDASGNVIWQGRLERAPRVSGEQMAISPSAVGYQAHLEDDKSVQVIFIDRELNSWREPSAVRRLAMIDTPVAVGGIGSQSDTNGTPVLGLTVQGAWAAAAGTRAEAWYEAPASTNVATVYLTWATGTNIGTGTADWAFSVYSSDDEATFPEGSADQLTGAASTGSLVYSPATPRRFFDAQLSYASGAAGTDGTEYEIRLSNVAVLGDHGLTLRVSGANGGFYDADMIGYALSRWCPQIAYTSESLTSDSFVVPHAAFKDATTVGEILKQATRFRLRDWAVWEGPLFWLHDRNARGNKWRARVGPTQLEETGPQVDRLWNSIIVQYQDVDGSTRTVGPTGSGVDTESSYLVDDDPENPATKAGITRRDLLTMGVSTSEGAIEVGRRFLEQSKQLDSSGRARIVGHVQDDRGVWHPYSHVRAGDQIAFVDANDSSYRRIVKTDKSRSDRSCSIDLDAPPEGLQSLLERLGVVLVPLGL